MGVRYQILNQVLGAGGYVAPMVNAEFLRFVIVNRGGGVDVTCTWETDQGRGSTWTVHPGGAFNQVGWFRNFKVTGSGATVEGGFFDPSDEVDAATLLVQGNARSKISKSGATDTIFTVPAGFIWKVFYASITLGTSGNAGNRQVSIGVLRQVNLEGASTAIDILASTDKQTGTTSTFYAMGSVSNTSAILNGTTISLGMNPTAVKNVQWSGYMVLQPDDQISVSSVLVAGDSYTYLISAIQEPF